MSSPIISVTEGRVTVTANDTEESIREAAGFTEPKPDDTASPEREAPSTETAANAGTSERNPDGTFKGIVTSAVELAHCFVYRHLTEV